MAGQHHPRQEDSEALPCRWPGRGGPVASHHLARGARPRAAGTLVSSHAGVSCLAARVTASAAFWRSGFGSEGR